MIQGSKRTARTFSLCQLAAAAGMLCHSAGAATAETANTVRVIVGFKPNARVAMKSLASSVQGTVQHEIFGTNAVAMEVPRTALKGLENNPNVAFIEEDVKRYPLALTSPSTGYPTRCTSRCPTASSWSRPTS